MLVLIRRALRWRARKLYNRATFVDPILEDYVEGRCSLKDARTRFHRAIRYTQSRNTEMRLLAHEIGVF